MHEFNQCLSFDKTMYKADIIGSQVYAAGLKEAGILNAEECQVSDLSCQVSNQLDKEDRPFIKD